MNDDFLFKSHRPMEEDTKTPDAPTPLNSTGGYKNATGEFNLKQNLVRKPKSRKDLGQPKFSEDEDDDANKRYFGAFSMEAKRHVWDLLKQHPKFGDKSSVRLNRVQNNTRMVLKNDPTKTIENGGHIVYQNQPQASEG